MLVLIDSDTRQVIAKFADEQIARIAGRVLSRETHRPLTLAINEAAKIPVARFRDGAEIQHTATIHYLE
jgi:hypothetical protein